jgi:hypothetical protein
MKAFSHHHSFIRSHWVLRVFLLCKAGLYRDQTSMTARVEDE